MTDEERLHGMRVVRLANMPPDRALIVPPGWPGPPPHTVETGETSVHDWLRDVASAAELIALDHVEPQAHVTITHVHGHRVDPGTVDPDQPPGLAGV